MRRTETPKPIWIKFCTVVDIPNVVTCTNFGDHRLRGFWVAGGQISPSPIDFHRRPYNTLALPCERVTRYYLTCNQKLTCQGAFLSGFRTPRMSLILYWFQRRPIDILVKNGKILYNILSHRSNGVRRFDHTCQLSALAGPSQSLPVPLGCQLLPGFLVSG